MRVRRFPRLLRVMAALLVLAAVRLPHGAADDPACVPAAVPAYGQHDESLHQLQAATPSDDDHCAVCHWTRSLRSPLAPLSVAAACVAPSAGIDRADDRSVLFPSLEDLPARAPPVPLP